MIKLKDILNEKQQLNEKKKLDQRFLDDIHKMTQSNNHTLARFQLAKYMGNDKLSKFYAAMEQLNDVFNGEYSIILLVGKYIKSPAGKIILQVLLTVSSPVESSSFISTSFVLRLFHG